MSLNETPSSERVHIGLFGRRNAGKSSLMNAITGQSLAVVSDVPGTTTDPVRKSIELLPIGPVLLIDTPGMDDVGELGAKRVEKARQVLRQTDVAVLVVDARAGKSGEDDELLELFESGGVPRVTVYSKCDLLESRRPAGRDEMFVSAVTGENMEALKEHIARLTRSESEKLRIVGDLLNPSDFVVLVVPIDKAAPKGRLILPQQQTIRDVLEADAAAIVVKEFELRDTLRSLGKRPRMVITDSQVFAKVSADTPPDVDLTSFSILMARYKGVLDEAVRGVIALEKISDGDKILISEGCTHHRQCDDIGTVKLPRWIRQHTGKKPIFEFTSGGSFPDDLFPYKLIIHCGACMLNEREMKHRQREAVSRGVPITNFGVLIAHMQGILERSVSVFPHLSAELSELAEREG
ncbi:MAG: [FeFe] hydrogenase H-cluster maturation GTPase HydF [Synergistaceae bacterium]|jgi:[FeFe] hydrogenase H-cluster maturation GTPase HydF|nr:[FeFe] hydrogenase H-cluster maturation GTPase HydF [Synergistaceae bacterium]